MTFSFLFRPRGNSHFLPCSPRRRFRSRYPQHALRRRRRRSFGGLLQLHCTHRAADLFASGMSAESVLATMFASPALNVVVLAMTFALFPVSIALIKTGNRSLLDFRFCSRRCLSPKNCKKTAIPCPIEIPSAENLARKLWLASRALSPKVSGTSREWPCR